MYVYITNIKYMGLANSTWQRRQSEEKSGFVSRLITAVLPGRIT